MLFAAEQQNKKNLEPQKQLRLPLVWEMGSACDHGTPNDGSRTNPQAEENRSDVSALKIIKWPH